MTRPRLLLINKFYHDVGPAGGVGRYLVQEEADLTAAGWDVIPFAMADEHARPSPWASHFPRARDYSEARWREGALGDALSLIWNREASACLDDLIAAARPQVAHIHNIYHHLTPSILGVLRRRRIPTVMTLHDLRLLCPAIHMLRNDQVCERCRGGHLYQAVLGKCVKNSRGASLLAAAETAHQRSRRLYEKTVSTFLCPSRFIRDKYAEWGFPADRLQHLANFVDLDYWRPEPEPGGARDAVLYFGRISREKGVRFLLEAWSLWEKRHADGTIDSPPPRLLIAGDGPCIGNMKARASLLKLKTLEILGPLDRAALRRTLARAHAAAIPSACYENAPMAALEALASGVPVVGSDLGGLPELIEPGLTGEVFAPGDAEALLAALRRRVAADGDAAARRCRAWAEEHASRRTHMTRLDGVLRGLLA